MIELLNMNCMDYLATRPDKSYDLAIVDPPYGSIDAINPVSSENKYQAKRGNYKEFDNILPEQKYFEEVFRVSKKYIIWGGNYFGTKGGVIVWDKNGTAFGEGEIAICNTHKSVRIFEYTWNGMIQQDMKNKESRIHPTQKPVALYKWILHNYAKTGDKILDTHGGSMSIAIACHQMGYDLTLTEIDKGYYDAGVKRYNEAIKQQSLFQ